MKKKKDGQNNSQNKEKPKKEKIIYIDDNSTVADMSNTRSRNESKKRTSTFKEKARTYFSVVKKMLLPMFVTLFAFTIVYLLCRFLLTRGF